MASIGGPDLLWTANQKVGTIEVPHQPSETLQKRLCLAGDKILDCEHGLFQDAAFARYLQDFPSMSGGVFMCI